MNTARDIHEEALALQAICHVLGQLEGSRAKGEYLLAEIAKNPDTLVRYIRTAYHPHRQFDHIFKATVPHGLMAKVLERADAGELHDPPELLEVNPGDLRIEITATPRNALDTNASPAFIECRGERVGNIVFYMGRPMKEALTLLRRLGVNIVFPKHLR
jgi:hypothetical protein